MPRTDSCYCFRLHCNVLRVPSPPLVCLYTMIIYISTDTYLCTHCPYQHAHAHKCTHISIHSIYTRLQCKHTNAFTHVLSYSHFIPFSLTFLSQSPCDVNNPVKEHSKGSRARYEVLTANFALFLSLSPSLTTTLSPNYMPLKCLFLSPFLSFYHLIFLSFSLIPPPFFSSFFKELFTKCKPATYISLAIIWLITTEVNKLNIYIGILRDSSLVISFLGFAFGRVSYYYHYFF